MMVDICSSLARYLPLSLADIANAISRRYANRKRAFITPPQITTTRRAYSETRCFFFFLRGIKMTMFVRRLRNWSVVYAEEARANLTSTIHCRLVTFSPFGIILRLLLRTQKCRKCTSPIGRWAVSKKYQRAQPRSANTPELGSDVQIFSTNYFGQVNCDGLLSFLHGESINPFVTHR